MIHKNYSLVMIHEEAYNLLKDKVQNQNLIKHCIAAEACMRALAEFFDEDKEKWGITGLLHDIDYEGTKNDPVKHSIVGAEILEKLGIDKEIVEAVKTHNEIHEIVPQSKMAKAIYCVDPLTGLIVASTLVLPSKKIVDLTVENVLNRFKEKGFAKGANREIIAKCHILLDLPLENFVKICLEAMKKISNELEL
ncbi:MAG: HDIG domain-containing protein [bacterium]|nr:HDIG domain-containing protein [bacterium]